MTPVAKSAAAAGEAVVPEKLLQQGEVVILAIKPSVWFIVLYSWPAIALAAGLVVAAFLAQSVLGVDVRPELVLLFCAAMVLAHLLVACCQWGARLYVLTNVRIMRVRGVFRVELFQCPLKEIQNVALTTSTQEKIFAVGSLFFQGPSCKVDEPSWLHISHPGEVHELVRDTIARSRT